MEWIVCVLLGGFVGLDATSFPQAMYSRPMVAGALAGVLLGQPMEGVLIGVILELFSLPVLPFGAAGYPEGGTAAVASVIAYDWVADVLDPGLLFIAVALGLITSQATGFSVRLLRLRNGRALDSRALVDRLDPAVLERTHRTAMLLDFVRGAVVTTVAAALIAIALELAIRTGWTLPIDPMNVLIAATVVMAGGSLTVFGTPRERIAAFTLGAGVTALLVWVLA